MGDQAANAQRYVAFLRAINVGGHTVKMDRLRALFAEQGFANVSTFIASGNVLFDGPAGDATALERQIERHLRQTLGYEVDTFLRTPAEVAAVAAHRPFGEGREAAGDTLYIAFLGSTPDEAAVQRLLALRNEVDDFHIHGREVYWGCRRTVSTSTFSPAKLEKILGMAATLRNATTVRKLAGLVRS
ncbi:MAG TPA: DUF1697 domain-containing protein [Roseiflexaceae bacterium]|nr:DUF1697 domain-containing protein [Roseiflexaceae bacterium]